MKLGVTKCIVLNCIVYRYLYSVSHSVSQTEALSMHFSSRKNVRLKASERRGKGSREDKWKGGGRRFQSDGPIEVKDIDQLLPNYDALLLNNNHIWSNCDELLTNYHIYQGWHDLNQTI